MLRRSGLWRVMGQNAEFRKHASRESERIHNERRRRIIYDSQGNLQLGGLVFLLYEDFHKPFLLFCGALLLFYGYNRLLVFLSSGDDVRTANVDRHSEEAARKSGKLKSERYLVKPQRQIDDPDFLDIPAFAGKGTHHSKLFVDDDASSNPLFSGKNRS